MLSTIWLDVLQFSTRAENEAVQLASGRLNALVANHYKSLPLRSFKFLRVKRCLQNKTEQTIRYYLAARTETQKVSSGTFDSVLRKLSNAYIEQFQIDCFCSESFGLFFASQPNFDRVQFGLFRYVTDFGSDLHECMLAPTVTLTVMQFRPSGFVLFWDGSLDESAAVALSNPLIRNSIRHLVIVFWESGFNEETSEFLLNFIFDAHELETCTILSDAEAGVLAQWLWAFIKRFTNARDGDHHVSDLHVCLLRDCRGDDSGESMQSKLSNGDSELGFYPGRAVLEQEVVVKIEPDGRPGRVNFSTTGQGRITRYQNKHSRNSLRLFTWEVEIEQLVEQNRMEDNNKAEFAVIEIS